MIPLQKEINKIPASIITQLTSNYKGESIDDFCNHITDEIKINYHFPMEKIKIYEQINKELDSIKNRELEETISQIKEKLDQKSNETIYAKPEYTPLSTLYR